MTPEELQAHREEIEQGVRDALGMALAELAATQAELEKASVPDAFVKAVQVLVDKHEYTMDEGPSEGWKSSELSLALCIAEEWLAARSQTT